MRTEVIQHIRTQPELWRYLRMHPSWYRKLSRSPEALGEMEKEAKVFYGKTFPQRMDRIQNNVNLAAMLFDMVRQMGQQ
ncbi:YlbE-like family protein [Alteribacter aurantiacus]|uniref:YlbE-like family protein n=1 Tax=Alteribacter aurantiacus TaxID=254410 RepID=UPI0004796972|nr:YlbE-like family protein [Alteribacter aurantiacus]